MQEPFLNLPNLTKVLKTTQDLGSRVLTSIRRYTLLTRKYLILLDQWIDEEEDEEEEEELEEAVDHQLVDSQKNTKTTIQRLAILVQPNKTASQEPEWV